MKKVLIIGDSHASALKLGVDILRSENNLNFEVDFCVVGSRFGGFASLKISENRLLLPENHHELAKKLYQYYSDRDEFLINEYDVIAIACAGPLPSPLNIANYHCDGSLLLSSELVSSIVFNLRRYKKMVSKLFYLFPEKLIIIGAPPPSSLDPLSSSIIERHHKSNLDRLYGKILDCCSKYYNSRNPKFLLPPEHLLAESLFQTKSEFMRNAPRKNNTIDYKHANEKYGVEVVKVLSDMITSH